MQFTQMWQKYKFAILAICVIAVLFAYNIISVQYTVKVGDSDAGADAAATTDTPPPAPVAPAPAASEGFQGQADQKQMDPMHLLPQGKGGLLEPSLKTLLEIPTTRTFTERVGRQREVNRNPYIINGVQYEQPEVSSQPLNVNLPTIQMGSGFAKNRF
jgi:hypothetical protein